MKKISILLFAVMMAGSLSAQIEEVRAEDYAPKKEITEKKSIDYLHQATYPADLLKLPYNLIGHQLYCTQDHISRYPIVALTISPDESIGLKRLTKGAYYTVTNIFCARKEMHNNGWQDNQLIEFRDNIINSKNFVGDTLLYVENGKEKIYYLSKYKKEHAPILLQSWMFRKSNSIIDILYELTDAKGLKYYIGIRDKESIQLKNGITIAVSPSIGDFISVNTFNYLKAKYENMELVRCEYYDPSCQREYSKDYKVERNIVKVEKIGINKKEVKEQQEIVFVFYDKAYGETKLEPYKRETILVPSRHADTIPTVVLGFNDGYQWVLRTDADSLLNKWYQEEQIKQAQARAEKAKQKADYIKKYGEKFAQSILDGKVCVGMTKEMCQEAMGRPNNTTRNSSSLGIVELWTYSTWYPLMPITVVTFLDNKVTSVDEYKDNYPF